MNVVKDALQALVEIVSEGGDGGGVSTGKRVDFGEFCNLKSNIRRIKWIVKHKSEYIGRKERVEVEGSEGINDEDKDDNIIIETKTTTSNTNFISITKPIAL